MNVLLACDFDMRVTYCLAGYEGSANDCTVLKKAKEPGGISVPTGHFYLANGGYSKKDKLVLVPYQKTRYYLREQAAANQRLKTMEELFNLRHAQARNCVERLNGVLKERWPALRDGPNKGYSPRQQSRFVYSLVAVHNFILARGQTPETEEFEASIEDERSKLQEGLGTAGIDAGTDVEMESRRDRIARAMWSDYRAVLEARGDAVAV